MPKKRGRGAFKMNQEATSPVPPQEQVAPRECNLPSQTATADKETPSDTPKAPRESQLMNTEGAANHSSDQPQEITSGISDSGSEPTPATNPNETPTSTENGNDPSSISTAPRVSNQTISEKAALNPSDDSGNSKATTDSESITGLAQAPRVSKLPQTDITIPNKTPSAPSSDITQAPRESQNINSDAEMTLPAVDDLELTDEVTENDAMETDEMSTKMTRQCHISSRTDPQPSTTTPQTASETPSQVIAQGIVLPATTASAFVPPRKRPSNESSSSRIPTTPEKQPKCLPPSVQPPQAHPQEHHPWKDILLPRTALTEDLSLLANDSLFPKNATETPSLLGCMTPTDVQKFRRSTHDWYKERAPARDLTKTLDPLVTTTNKPAGPSALYVVSKFFGRKAILTAINIDLYLPDRADLRRVVLSIHSVNTLQKGAVEPRDHLVVGDILFVQKLQRTEKFRQQREGANGKVPRDTTLEETLLTNYFVDWNVEEYQVFARRQLMERIAIVEGETPETTGLNDQQKAYKQAAKRSIILDSDSFDVAVEGFYRLTPSTARLLRGSNALASGATLGVLVFTPLAFPFLFSATPALQEQRSLLGNEYKKAGRQQYFAPSIVDAWPLSDATVSTLANRDNLWAGTLDKAEACSWLHKGFSVGLCGQEGIQNRYEDHRTHRVQLTLKNEGSNVIAKCVFNVQHSRPKVKAWIKGVRIVAGIRGLKIPGEVREVHNTKEALTIYTKFVASPAQILLREFDLNPDAFFTIRQVTGLLPRSTEEFFTQPNPLDINEDGARFHQAVRAVFGGARITLGMEPVGIRVTVRYNGRDIVITEEQAVIVSATKGSPMPFVISASFGCGKTWLANFLQALLAQAQPGKLHIIVSQSNFAVVNAVRAAAGFEDFKELPILRLITPQNMALQAEHTEFDLPTLMRQWFEARARTLNDGPERRGLHRFLEILYRLEGSGAITEKDIGLEAMLEAIEMDKQEKTETKGNQADKKEEKSEWQEALEVFFALYKPRRIFATTATFIAMISPTGPLHEYAKDVELVIFDEASQLPACVLAHYAHMLPNARPILIGDKNQLPPFAPMTNAKLINKLASGEVLSDVLENNMWSHLPLEGVFRNHPWLTKLLSDVFYNGRLVPAVDARHRESYRRQIWMPNQAVPAAFLHVLQGQQESVTGGQSMSNYVEMLTALEVARILVRHYGVQNVALLSLYREQAENLRRHVSGSYLQEVFISTVDASQGREFEATILCTTRTEDPHNSLFFKDAKRCNVALSRTKELLIVLGNLYVLRQVHPWNQIMQIVDSYSATTTDAQWIRQNGGEYYD